MTGKPSPFFFDWVYFFCLRVGGLNDLALFTFQKKLRSMNTAALVSVRRVTITILLRLVSKRDQKHERRCSHFPPFESSLRNEDESTRTDGLSVLKLMFTNRIQSLKLWLLL